MEVAPFWEEKITATGRGPRSGNDSKTMWGPGTWDFVLKFFNEKNLEKNFQDSVLVGGCVCECEMDKGERNGPHLWENADQEWILPPT